MKPTEMTAEEREEAAELLKIPNIGPAMARYLMRLGIYTLDDLAEQDADEMYEALCTMDAVRYDPCMLDVFAAAIAYANGGPARPWWEFSRERKAKLEELKQKK